MATITIMDPVTRIEGHMKVEVTVDGPAGGQYKITDARCTGTLFRGFETLLVGRHPWDAPIITERICGVCPVSHGMASVLALDAASGKKAVANGRILRNLVLGANYIQSHILHFYLLAALDYVADPSLAPPEAAWLNSAPWAPNWSVDQRGGTDIPVHMGGAIEARRRAHEMGAVFGGRMPSPHTYVAGGFTAVPDTTRISRFRTHLRWLQEFIQGTYIPDVQALASVYGDYLSIGKGPGNLLAFGVFDQNDLGTSKLLGRGLVFNSAPTSVRGLNTNYIRESVTYSWYDNGTNNLNPAKGLTKPLYPKTDAYSWLKAPRYGNLPFETGPLARMWVNGDYRRGISVMDRHMARAQEALKVALAMDTWLDQLVPGAEVFNTASTIDGLTSGTGIGMTEAPRGALGHWVGVSEGKIANYQVLTPTCWNASPRDSKGIPGPMEQALMGTPIEDPAKPIEALRVIHSFDPCLSCAVHVMRPDGKPIVVKDGAK